MDCMTYQMEDLQMSAEHIIGIAIAVAFLIVANGAVLFAIAELRDIRKARTCQK